MFTNISSARIENDPEGDLQAEQAVYQPEELTEVEFPNESFIHQGSFASNQFELSQLQDQSGLLLANDQEN